MWSEWRERIRDQGRLKLLALLAHSVGLVTYGIIQRCGEDRAVTMSWSSWDAAIPIMPWLAPIYVAQLVLWELPFVCLRGRSAWKRAHLGIAGAVLLCWSIHVVYPTQVERPAVSELAWLHTLDGAGNAWPSLHAVCGAYAFVLWMSVRPRPSWFLSVLLIWTLLVLWSCVALRQHTLNDLIAGVGIGLVAGIIARVHRGESSS